MSASHLLRLYYTNEISCQKVKFTQRLLLHTKRNILLTRMSTQKKIALCNKAYQKSEFLYLYTRHFKKSANTQLNSIHFISERHSMKIHGIFLILIASCCINSYSQTSSNRKILPRDETKSKASEISILPPQKKDWDKEPENFLGIVLGERFSVEVCPTRNIGQTIAVLAPDFDAIQKLPGVCHIPQQKNYTKATPYSYKIINLPDLGIPYSVTARIQNDVVEKIVIELKQENFMVLADAFMQRYGEPTSTTVNSVRNNLGVDFSAKEIKWRGKNISIYMYERFNRVDESYVLISTNSAIDSIINSKPEASEVKKF